MYKFLTKTKGRNYAWCYRISMLFIALLRLALLTSSKLFKQSNEGSIQKWRAILQWSFRGNKLIKEF